MPLKPVQTLTFWNQRINSVLRGKRSYHQTIYECTDDLWKRTQQETVRIIKKHVPEDSYILDAGCGYGALLSVLPSTYRYTGVDFCPKFIERAQEEYPLADFRLVNLKTLPFASGTFDWAVMRSMKAMLIREAGQDEWDKIEKEVLRVAKHILSIEYLKIEEKEVEYEVI